MKGELHCSAGYMERWIAEFRAECDKTWELTTVDSPGDWMSFKKVWKWRRKICGY